MKARAIAPGLGLGSMLLMALLAKPAQVQPGDASTQRSIVGWAGGRTVDLAAQPVLPDQVAAPAERAAALVSIAPPPDFKDGEDAAPAPLSPFPSFNSPRLDQQIRLYAHYLATEGPPDVLVVGSSRALQGIDPIVLQEALVARGIASPRVYNFSINGATARVVDLMVRRILLPNQLPRVVVWADGSRAFNNGRPDRTYNAIASSPGYRQLGTRPGGIQHPVPDLEALQALLETSEPNQTEADQWGELRAMEPVQENAAPPERQPAAPPPRTLVDLLPPLPTTDLTANGFQSVVDQFQPATYYRRFPRVAGRYDSNYAPWQLEGAQTGATVAIAQYLRDRRIPLVFVSLPLSREHLDDNFRRRAEQQFRRHLQRLSSQNGFLFRDLSQRWLTEYSYFADPSHLNRNGAQAVARQIAADPGTAWERWLRPPSNSLSR